MLTRQTTDPSGASDVTLGDDDIIEVRTVGADVGSATSLIAFSDLRLERSGSRYIITSRSVFYQSEVLLTPFTSEGAIDGGALAEFFASQYERAGVADSDVQTGVVILTGAALLRRNARAIAEVFATQSGRFISVAAGDHLEAILAAHGAGAVVASRRRGGPVISVDIGGGTTKLALCVDGAVESATAVDVGARLIAWDEDGIVVRLEPAGAAIAAAANVRVALGEAITRGQRQSLAQYMASIVADAAAGRWDSPHVAALLRAKAPPRWCRAAVIVSGGIAGYLDGSERRTFGDLGAGLALALGEAMSHRGLQTTVANAAMRATVVGASQYTLQLSGATIYLSDSRVLPLRSVPVSDARPGQRRDGSGDELQRLVQHAISMTPDEERAIVLSVEWSGSADPATLDQFCRGVLAGVAASGRRYEALVLAVSHDVAHLVGSYIAEDLGYSGPLVVLDGVELGRFDFVDIGNYLPHSACLPVTVKSLAFP